MNFEENLAFSFCASVKIYFAQQQKNTPRERYESNIEMSPVATGRRFAFSSYLFCLQHSAVIEFQFPVSPFIRQKIPNVNHQSMYTAQHLEPDELSLSPHPSRRHCRRLSTSSSTALRQLTYIFLKKVFSFAQHAFRRAEPHQDHEMRWERGNLLSWRLYWIIEWSWGMLNIWWWKYVSGMADIKRNCAQR